MKILIVNDDSLSAEGIAVLSGAALEFGDVYVVAPNEQCSAMSQRLTLRETLSLERVADFPIPVRAAYRLGGTPVDCVKVALEYILDEKPELVLSGINHGYNIGYDIAYSGTVGAAMEAARQGIPTIAFSVAGKTPPEAATPYIASVLRRLLDSPWEYGQVWNVNFPRLELEPPKGICMDCPVARVGLYREHYVEVESPEGTVELRNVGISTSAGQIPAGTDGDTVRRGYIAVSKLSCIL